jgi:Peptidase A4 family
VLHRLPSMFESLTQETMTIARVCMLLGIVGTAAALVSIQRPDGEWVSDSAGHLFHVKRMTLRHHGPMQLHRKRDQTTSESYNWSGYAVTGSKGSVTDVKASWVVPAVGATANPCPTSTPPDEGPYASFWVGIDGWNSNTVEQIGTDSDCVNAADTQGNTPTYYAWFEFYPHSAYYIGNPDDNFSGYSVSPGDYISAEVKSRSSSGGPRHSGGQQFTVTITDQTQGWTFSTSSSVSAQQSSAEWIAETPYGCSTKSGFCLLTDFNVADYGEEFTPFSGTASATVSGKTGAISSFGNDVQQAIMVSDPSGAEMSVPSGLLDSDNDPATSFSLTWKNLGP